MEKIIPPGLNYADIKPEAIENQIRMTKFIPISNVKDQRPNDVVRFHLQGNGFFDPYSAYIRIRVAVNMDDVNFPPPTAANVLSGLFLDRSAHSLFSRLVIRSQGTELERIEQYDVLAAMINDMVYSSEQRQLHHYEGFATKQMVRANAQTGIALNRSLAFDSLSAIHMVSGDGPDSIQQHFGDRGFSKVFIADSVANVAVAGTQSCLGPQDFIGLNDLSVPITMNTIAGINRDGLVAIQTNNNASAGYTYDANGGNPYGIVQSGNQIEFCLPIYSGIIGVLMPDKKLLPLSLLPLEVEFTMNPQAFYPVGNMNNRQYTIETFEIWTHTLFFEQELHRSLEAVVAEAGIFLHYSSFYLCPINTYNGNVLPQYHQLGIYLKSVEALHWVFLYTDQYQQENGTRKLHFVSHNLTNLQLRNGMDLIPSEPIQAKTGGRSMGPGSIQGSHHQLLIETYKGWNKMHDPLSDGAITPFNYNIDGSLGGKPRSYQEFLQQQTSIGRCQYALSLVGEEIGQNKTIVSGKKTVLPFDLNFNGTKSGNLPSILLCYLRADFIIYVRPDLVVTRLGL